MLIEKALGSLGTPPTKEIPAQFILGNLALQPKLPQDLRHFLLCFGKGNNLRSFNIFRRPGSCAFLHLLPRTDRTFDVQFLQSYRNFTNPGNHMQLADPAQSIKLRASRLEARISSEQKALLQHAASLSGRTLSEFIVQSAQEAASRIIKEQELVQLSRAEQFAFVETLLNPPKPNARLRKAVKQYRAEMGV
jgi:uncharacterized protein (DUF1778 family)